MSVKTEQKNDSKEARLKSRVEAIWQSKYEKVLPGFCLEVLISGDSKFQCQVGTTYKYYDLASLSKTIFTVSALMFAFQDKKWNENSFVHEILSDWPHPETQIKHLLTHTSGLIWWKPFYEELLKVPVTPPDYSLRWAALRKNIFSEPLDQSGLPLRKAVYSDAGFLVLGFILQEMYQASLQDIFKMTLQRLKVNSDLHFSPTGLLLPTPEDYGPTENESWRGNVNQGKILQGYVHDENAYSLGGISSHAGLFGNTSDVAKWFQQIRLAYLGKHPELNVATVKTFFTRAITKEQGDFALGFMLPTVNSSSCGAHFALSSIGHTGFTGTSFWFDLEKDLFVTLLSNRTIFGRDRPPFDGFRPQIHDACFDFFSEKT